MRAEAILGSVGYTVAPCILGSFSLASTAARYLGYERPLWLETRNESASGNDGARTVGQP
jgi:hypothetical protein